MKNIYHNVQQFRCPKCNKLLFKYQLIGHLSLDIKCSRCNSYLKYEFDCTGTNTKEQS